MFGNKTSLETIDFQASAASANVATCTYSSTKLSCVLSASVLTRLTTGTTALNQFRIYLPFNAFTNGNGQADFITLRPGAKMTVTYMAASQSPTRSRSPTVSPSTVRRVGCGPSFVWLHDSSPAHSTQ
jgi:hypothetical protein